MTGPGSWNETPAGLLLNRGMTVEAPGTVQARKFAENRSARIGYAAALAADPEWQAARAAQEELAERGWTGNVIHIGDTTPPELRGLYLAQTAAEARVGTFYQGQPTNDVAREIEQAARDRLAAAQLRQKVQNQHLPPGVEAL